MAQTSQSEEASSQSPSGPRWPDYRWLGQQRLELDRKPFRTTTGNVLSEIRQSVWDNLPFWEFKPHKMWFQRAWSIHMRNKVHKHKRTQLCLSEVFRLVFLTTDTKSGPLCTLFWPRNIPAQFLLNSAGQYSDIKVHT